MTQRRSLGVGITLLLVLAACEAGRTDQASSPQPTYRMGESAPIDWAQPRPGFAVEVTDVAAARERLPFDPIVPREGPTQAIFTSPDSSKLEGRAIWFVLEARSGDLYWVVELVAEGEEQFDAYADQCNNEVPGCSASVTNIRGGAKALISKEPLGWLVMWYEEGLQLSLMAPHQPFDEASLVELAESI